MIQAPAVSAIMSKGISSRDDKEESGEILLSSVAAGNVITADKIYNIVVNPSESGLFTRLASVANIYQKFTAKNFQIAYKPSVGSSTNGNLAIAFLPDINATIPATYEDVLAAGGNWTTPIWTPKAMPIEQNSLSRAFKENYCKIPENVQAQEQINVVGRLVWCVRNLPTANVSYGDLILQYHICFSDPKQPEVPPALSATYTLGATAGPSDLDFDDLAANAMTSGYHMIGEESEVAGTYALRSHQAAYIIFKGDPTGGVAPNLQVAVGYSPSVKVGLTPITTLTTAFTRWRTFYLPRGYKYIQVATDVALDGGTFEMMTISHVPTLTLT